MTSMTLRRKKDHLDPGEGHLNTTNPREEAQLPGPPVSNDQQGIEEEEHHLDPGEGNNCVAGSALAVAGVARLVAADCQWGEGGGTQSRLRKGGFFRP